jgi:hypothetical protein
MRDHKMLDELKADILALKAITYVLVANQDREAVNEAAVEIIRRYSLLPREFNQKACEAVTDILM